MRDYKIVILGKSALTIRFVYDNFVEKYDPTIEDSFRTVAMVDGYRCQVELLDTAGTEQFMALHSLYMKSGDGFVLAFSLTSLDSINELQTIREQILRTKEAEGLTPEEVPLVLVGNKCDLVHERQVPREVGIQLSQAWAKPYYEASARHKINVEELFEDILRQVVRQNPPGQTGKKKRKLFSRCNVL
ncbi:uncharacterized protein L969DRAFT_93940 [Mixia osmundae IAM 14324]|uniref:Uncharacterized protein n=1 Tax=Mixia osmundae (strain CBS 9802 / IAM 14324 / JCM 22182 / KY 12970) TaxID=764103 RepID=G7E8L2_MIXOS|nr:uncharacterized protein L969DRAFT_93940 [Mixia osmundae IAM 14324]KEI40114.1 hypothetical protein L969DRAFT_93940 [Mixia osmundae IAM 14324]GAA99480.1 hypothetical protein E5Q_06180 [Mixia osmundae IAM 14324]